MGFGPRGRKESDMSTHVEFDGAYFHTLIFDINFFNN